MRVKELIKLTTGMLVAASVITGAYAANYVVPVVVESGNSGNYLNVVNAQVWCAVNGQDYEGHTFSLANAYDQDVKVQLYSNGVVGPDGWVGGAGKAHATVAVRSSYPTASDTTYYVWIAISTDSGIGIRHSMSTQGYEVRALDFTVTPTNHQTQVITGAIQTIINNGCASGGPQWFINTGCSEVGAGTIVDITNRFKSGVYRSQASATFGQLYNLSTTTALVFKQNGSTSTAKMLDIPFGIVSYPYSGGAQPIVVIMRNHNISNPTTNADRVKYCLDRVSNLTTNELSKIFSGLYKYWGEVGSFAQVVRQQGWTSTEVADTLNQAMTTPIAVYVREPVSGTYNTFESCVMWGKGRSQEMLFNIATPGKAGRGYNDGTNDPRLTGRLDDGAFSKGGRVIGGSAMLSAVRTNDYAIGYTFHSTANFASDDGRTHYVWVDGVDPLCRGGVDLDPRDPSPKYNIVDYADVYGNYPIWANLQVVFRQIDPMNDTTPAEKRLKQWYERYASGATTLPLASMKWIRSRRAEGVNMPDNGTKGTEKPLGNEDGGEVISKQRDATDGEFTGLHQP